MDELQCWLALARAPRIGGAATDRLLAGHGDLAALFASGRGAMAASGLHAETIDWLLDPDPVLLDGDRAWLEQPGHHLVWRGHPAYPRLLADVPGAPAALFVTGDPEWLEHPQIAVIGSRTPTAMGLETASAFASHLARAGFAITSGLAAGIDAAAHRGALASGGATVAVLGTGPDRIYPAANAGLARQIAANGALVTEFPPGTPPRRGHFPQRNRIIAALTLGTLVVEAAHRSGTLITAHRAIEYGREVFAIPGSIHNPLARGCHRLIREGAKLVESAADILEELGAIAAVAMSHDEDGGTAAAPVETLDEDYSKLLECIGWEPTAVDSIVERSGLTAHEVSSMLLILELRGYVSPSSRGGFTRTGKRLK